MADIEKRIDSAELARDILRRLEAMKAQRRPFDTLWQEVAEFAGPEYLGFNNRKGIKAQKQRSDITSSEVRRAADIFSAGMLSGMSNPADRWFGLIMQDDALAANPAVKRWTQACEDIFYSELEQINFYAEQHLGYHQSGLFGMQCLYMDESPEKGIRCHCRPLYELYIGENHQRVVDTVFREFSLTAHQAIQKFGEANLSDQIKSAQRSKDYTTEFDFVHAVFPNEEGDGKFGKRFGFVSYYLEKGDNGKVIAEGGYDEQPYIVSRAYRLPWSPYSYSPGTRSLADTKSLNEMWTLLMMAGQMSVAPPYLIPDDGFVGNISYDPFSLNYFRKEQGFSREDFSPMQVGADPRFTLELLNAKKMDINEAFYVDLFLTIRNRIESGSTPTAQEIIQLTNERMFLLGPMLIKQKTENFDALFARLLMLKAKRGEIPPAPRELANAEMRVEYTSPLARAQKEAQLNSISRSYQDLAGLANIDPGVLDLVDNDVTARRMLDQRGFPVTGIRDEAQVRKIREQRAAQAQAQQKAQQDAMFAAEAAKAAPGLGKAVEPNSPMAGIVEAIRSQQVGPR